jgi:hypothetical protein
MVDGSPVDPVGPTPTEADILRTIRSLRFGAVEIQVHDGRVVQIERRERVRIEDRPRGR